MADPVSPISHKVPEAPAPDHFVSAALRSAWDAVRGHRAAVSLLDDETWWGTAKRAGAGLVLLAGLGLGAAGGLYWWLAQDKFNHVGYSDLALPWRWERIRSLRGQGYTEMGLQALADRRFDKAVFALRQGVARQPDNHEAVVAVCDRLLLRKLNEAERTWIVERKAASLLVLRHPASPLDLLTELPGRPTAMGLRLQANALIEAGRATEAVELLRTCRGELPETERLGLLAAACARGGQAEEMSDALRAWRTLEPTAAAPWCAAIEHYLSMGWRDAAWIELQSSLRRFDTNPDAFMAIERACSNAGAPAFVGACMERLHELGQPILPILLDLTVTQLRAGDTAAAEGTLKRIAFEETRMRARRGAAPAGRGRGALGAKPVIPGLLVGALGRAAGDEAELQPSARQWLAALVDAAASSRDDGALILSAALGDERMNLFAFDSSAAVLAKNFRWRGVQDVAHRGLQRFPWSSRLKRWDSLAASQVAATPVPEDTPEFPAAPMAVDLSAMAQEDFFARLDNAVRRRAWSEAAGLISAVNRAVPPWLGRVQGDLDWREIRCAFEEGDRPKVFSFVAQRLRRHPDEAVRGLELARQYRVGSDMESARLLITRLLLEVPDFAAGRTFLEEIVADTQKTTSGN